MRKLVLKLNDLMVESFDAAPQSRRLGTVLGQDDSVGPPGSICTGQPCCGETVGYTDCWSSPCICPVPLSNDYPPCATGGAVLAGAGESPDAANADAVICA